MSSNNTTTKKKVSIPRKGTQKRKHFDDKMAIVMGEFYKKKLFSCGKPVRNKKQAIAMALKSAKAHADRMGKPKKLTARNKKWKKTCAAEKEKYLKKKKPVKQKRVVKTRSSTKSKKKK